MSDVRDKVLGIFAAELRMPVDELTDQTSLADVRADSLDLIEIVMSLEGAFKIEISDDEWAAVTSVSGAVTLVEQKKKEVQ